jgi:crossover junction endodeoxyribonuclease RusA
VKPDLLKKQAPPWEQLAGRKLSFLTIDKDLSIEKDYVTLELPWPLATGNRQARHGKGGHYLNPLIARYRAQVAQIAAAQGWGGWDARKPLVGLLEASLVCAPPDKRARDLDNVAKVALDAIVQAGVLADDSSKVLRRLVLEWTDPEPGGRVLVTIRPHTSQCHHG